MSRGGDRPRRLARRRPINFSIRVELYRVPGTQLADAREAQIAHLHRCREETDRVMAGHSRRQKVRRLQPGAVRHDQHRGSQVRSLGTDDEPARKKERREWLRRLGAPAYFDVGAANDRVARPYRLPQQRHQGNAAFDSFEAQMDALVVDFDPFSPNAVRDRSRHVDDVERNARDAMRDASHDELQPAFREYGEVDRCAGCGDRHENQQTGEHEQQAAHRTCA